jgi:hypothetical protein
MRASRLGGLLMIWALGLTSSAATAGESVKDLEKKLLTDGDFRVRTQAALALGASGMGGAVQPLCRGLDDGTDTVRAAAAAGLGRLQKGGKACLEARLGKEDKTNVQKMIKKALRLIEEAASGPQLGRDTKYYVAIASPKANAGRDEVAGVVRAALIRSAVAAGDFAFAPTDETAQQAAKRLRKHPHVAAFHLVPTVEVSRGAGRIEVSVDLEIFGYPDKSPQGSIGRSAGVTGVDPKDTDKENQLIEKVCGEAMREFTRLAAQVD